jgi:hypothetical protein
MRIIKRQLRRAAMNTNRLVATVFQTVLICGRLESPILAVSRRRRWRQRPIISGQDPATAAAAAAAAAMILVCLIVAVPPWPHTRKVGKNGP